MCGKFGKLLLNEQFEEDDLRYIQGRVELIVSKDVRMAQKELMKQKMLNVLQDDMNDKSIISKLYEMAKDGVSFRTKDDKFSLLKKAGFIKVIDQFGTYKIAPIASAAIIELVDSNKLKSGL